LGEKGDRLYKNITSKRNRHTVICASNDKKIICIHKMKGSANAKKFMDFLKEVTEKVKNKYLLMDNARIHHSIIIKEYMKSNNKNNNEILYNIPYNPETNPIELIFSQVKGNYRKMNNKNGLNINRIIDKSFKKINSETISNCFIKSLGKYCLKY